MILQSNYSHPAFRQVPRTGVIYVMTEATRLGYSASNKQWCNFGQGAPETGPLKNSPERVRSVSFKDEEHEYAPVDGLPELREAVAELYNQRYRNNHSSKYTKDNVAISSGGRLGLTRVVSTLGRTNVGHFLPDYTAYEELLDAFGTFVPIPILLDDQSDYAFGPEDLRKEILGRGLSAVLRSNPCNPTGKLLQGEELEGWVSVCRELNTALIIDEFYSNFIYSSKDLSVSAAEFIDDVDKDPVLIVDGLTKNWRYPGWRVSWTVGPKDLIEAVASAGSFLDGGCARPMQQAALKLVNVDIADKEARSIKETFSKKKEYLCAELKELGIRITPDPEGSFYCWGDLRGLPEELQNGMDFFQKALEHKVIIVPGTFFDINPGQRRPDRPSRFKHFARFSFGPTIEELQVGVSSLKKLIKG